MKINNSFYDKIKKIETKKIQEALETVKKNNENQTITNAQLILQLCEIINSKITIYIRKLKYTKRRKKNVAQEEENEIMVYATQLIYLLRSFVTNEELVYHMNITTEEGKEISAFIPQKEILQNLSVTKNNAIGVSLKMQEFLINHKKNEYQLQTHRKNLWTQVKSLAETKYDKEKSNKVEIRKDKKTKEAIYAYQNIKDDIYVYTMFTGNKNNKQFKTSYYDKGRQGNVKEFQYFNMGWLWEWYNEILYGDDEIENSIVQSSIESYKSIFPIIKTPDNIRGTKQGDFVDFLGRQIQSKNNNDKIISYKNIYEVIYKLQNALQKIINTNEEEELISLLQKHFLPEGAKIVVNDIKDKFNAQVKLT